MLLQQQITHLKKRVGGINNSSEVISTAGKWKCVNLNSDPPDIRGFD
jgi:hypothetical protein